MNIFSYNKCNNLYNKLFLLYIQNVNFIYQTCVEHLWRMNSRHQNDEKCLYIYYTHMSNKP